MSFSVTVSPIFQKKNCLISTYIQMFLLLNISVDALNYCWIAYSSIFYKILIKWSIKEINEKEYVNC